MENGRKREGRLTERMEVNSECKCSQVDCRVMIVHDRIRGFLPQIQQANVLLETSDETIESVDDDEEHVEMVPSLRFYPG